jgi:hypothetical protein
MNQKQCNGKWVRNEYEHGVVWTPCHNGVVKPALFISYVGRKMKKTKGTMCNVCNTRYS